jgi:hypothetical protein
MIVRTGVAVMVRRPGHVRGGVAIMSVRIGRGASTTDAAGNEESIHEKAPRDHFAGAFDQC